jgi:hypothetical protein
MLPSSAARERIGAVEFKRLSLASVRTDFSKRRFTGNLKSNTQNGCASETWERGFVDLRGHLVLRFFRDGMGAFPETETQIQRLTALRVVRNSILVPTSTILRAPVIIAGCKNAWNMRRCGCF